MKCPKCNREIANSETICPHCKKVIAIECPNCHTLSTSSKCRNCGYILLTKCSKCGNIVNTAKHKCKCGFPVKTSIAYQECENDDFACLTIKIQALKNIRRLLGSQELYTKFYFKLKNLLTAQINNHDGNIIVYGDTFVINFNKELSFPTSSNKAVRLALKIVNAFSELNKNIIQELSTPLNLNICITRKNSEDLLQNITYDNNVKVLNIKKNQKKYLKGMQITLDQYVCDNISKDYTVDSLYTVEIDKKTIMFYEIILDKYILPPTDNKDEKKNFTIQQKEINNKKEQEDNSNDIFSFKVFDINAKCKFEKTNAIDILNKIDSNKIIAIRGNQDFQVNSSDLVKHFEKQGIEILHVICTEEMNYQPWGVLKELFKDFYKMPLHKDHILKNFESQKFPKLVDLVKYIPRQASSSEDSRFAYMEDFELFLHSLTNSVVIIENFEYIDETTIQTLQLYFDKFKNLNTQFIFTTNNEVSVHSKIKSLLRTPLYTEYTLQKVTIDDILTDLNKEASDFIQSFYYEKIKENFNGSALYFHNAIQYLKDQNILIDFEDKLIIKNNASIVIPNTLQDLIKARLKYLSKNFEASMILAYSNYLGARFDIEILSALGINNIKESLELLIAQGFIYMIKDIIYINNYNILKTILSETITSKNNDFLSKNMLSKIGKGLDDTYIFLIMGKLSMFKEEYLLLWKNSQFAINVGDYDAYLKNCLGFLSLIEHIKQNIPAEDIEQNKKEVYQNILLSLYNYAPDKIYDIENILLIDAINRNDNDKIVKLSNLMLQGALITSRYADAYSLVHNILSRMPNPTLIIDNGINTKFLLLSLVNIEILFNIGEYTQCVDTTKDLLNVIKPNLIEKIKPASFSSNLFKEHMQETFRLSAFAKLFLMDDELEEFLDSIKDSLGENIIDRECISNIKKFLNKEDYISSPAETLSPFSKIIYLILQEFQTNFDKPKEFAQNIYQAKLLATELHQIQLEYFCDLLIAHSYATIGIKEKALYIYKDIITKSQKASIFNIETLAKYFLSQLYLSNGDKTETLQLINDSLALIQKYNNQSKIIYLLFEKLFIQTIQQMDIKDINLEIEKQKVSLLISNHKLSRFD